MSKLSDTGYHPRVSVVIPAFNVGRYLTQSIHSALNQTFSDIEVIVADDGSTDDTAIIARAVEDPRVKLIQKSNGGCASARNAGLREAAGEYIAFLDGDDYWCESKIETELEFLDNNPQVDLVFCLSRMVDESGTHLGLQKYNEQRTYTFEDLLRENAVGNGSAILMRRSIFEQTGDFNEQLVASSDLEMWLRVTRLRPDNFVCLPIALVCYRRRNQQTTASWRRMANAYQQVLDLARAAEPEAVARVEPYSRYNKYRYHAFLAMEAGEFRAAARLLLASYKAAPRAFLCDLRSWQTCLALASQATLPEALHRTLFRLALRVRECWYRARLRS
ncbi:MAG: glycosyltransferase [Pirellulaceae bacterium]